LPDEWAAERADVLSRFNAELSKATGDGSKKRQSGEKPSWAVDPSHEAAIFSHLMKWKKGETTDPDSGAHPLVHAAWRCLAIACQETGNIPEPPKPEVRPTDDEIAAWARRNPTEFRFWVRESSRIYGTRYFDANH